MYVRSTKLVILAKVRERPRTKFVLITFELIKLLSVNGDGEIRTLDPLLARQVLSQLSYTPIWNIVNILFSIWQPPAFPYRHQYSIIGRFRLNHRVRDVDGCFPKAHRHQKIVSATKIH